MLTSILPQLDHHAPHSKGFNCVWCCIGESVAGKLSLRIQQLDVRCESKSKDNGKNRGGVRRVGGDKDMDDGVEG